MSILPSSSSTEARSAISIEVGIASGQGANACAISSELFK